MATSELTRAGEIGLIGFLPLAGPRPLDAGAAEEVGDTLGNVIAVDDIFTIRKIIVKNFHN